MCELQIGQQLQINKLSSALRALPQESCTAIATHGYLTMRLPASTLSLLLIAQRCDRLYAIEWNGDTASPAIIGSPEQSWFDFMASQRGKEGGDLALTNKIKRKPSKVRPDDDDRWR